MPDRDVKTIPPTTTFEGRPFDSSATRLGEAWSIDRMGERIYSAR
jgi:hypothetical protein